MAFMDYVQTAVSKIVPEKKHSMSIPVSTTGGIGSGGALPFDDDVSPAIFRFQYYALALHGGPSGFFSRSTSALTKMNHFT